MEEPWENVVQMVSQASSLSQLPTLPNTPKSTPKKEEKLSVTMSDPHHLISSSQVPRRNFSADTAQALPVARSSALGGSSKKANQPLIHLQL